MLPPWPNLCPSDLRRFCKIHKSRRRLTLLGAMLAGLSLSGCVSPSTPTPATPSAPQTVTQLGKSSADSVVLRMGYRWAKAGPSDQIVIPPERFMVVGVNGEALGPEGRMLTLPSGSTHLDVRAIGGPFIGDGQIQAKLQAGADYQLTGFLDSRGSPDFIVWLEDTLTHQPASPRQRLSLTRRDGSN